MKDKGEKKNIEKKKKGKNKLTFLEWEEIAESDENLKE